MSGQQFPHTKYLHNLKFSQGLQTCGLRPIIQVSSSYAQLSSAKAENGFSIHHCAAPMVPVSAHLQQKERYLKNCGFFSTALPMWRACWLNRWEDVVGGASRASFVLLFLH